MENDVGLFSIFAFTSSVARVFVQNTLDFRHNSAKSWNFIGKYVKTLKITLKAFGNDLKTLEYHLKALGNDLKLF